VATTSAILALTVINSLLPNHWCREFGYDFPEPINAESGMVDDDALRVAYQLIGDRFEQRPTELYVFSTGRRQQGGRWGYVGYVKAKVDRKEFDRVVDTLGFTPCVDSEDGFLVWHRWDLPYLFQVDRPPGRMAWWDPAPTSPGDMGNLIGRIKSEGIDVGKEQIKYEGEYLYFQVHFR